jgi:8-oxo-dGTP pyrophosphatase MutT (NUDIX family)
MSMDEALLRVRKAFAYITHRDRLLVFAHPDFPDAGIQVPAGTMRPDETPEAAVLREAWEETGLDGLRIVRFLGEQDFLAVSSDTIRFGDGQTTIHHRFFFHLVFEGEPRETWRHYELHDGLAPPTAFDMSWAQLPDGVPDLIAEHGRYVPELVASMASSRQL